MMHLQGDISSVNDYNTSNTMPIIAIYGGRFQPMGRHHKKTYDWMVDTFGYNNSFILTSDRVSPPKSPLSYDEKLSIAVAHGVPEDKFINENVPYAWRTWKNMPAILDQMGLSIDNVVVVYVVGQKDMNENPRFQPGLTKKGLPTYFQHYNSKAILQPGSVHGYLVVAPHVEFTLPDGEESSGTNLRNFLASASPEMFEAAMGFYNPQIDAMLKQKLSPPNTLLEQVTFSDKDVDAAIRHIFIKGLMK